MKQDGPFIIALKKIWPTIYHCIDITIYFIFNLMKTIVRRSIEQIKGIAR